MSTETIRVGIVGAGANTRLRHVPGFRAIDGVEILGVVNRSQASSDRAAAEFEIPRTYSEWQALVDDPDIDAVMIGTWPNMHCEITCAALEAGKHVLTEARMARNLNEARLMLQAAQSHPDLITQIVPSPLGLKHHDTVTRLIAEGFLGELRELVVIGVGDTFADDSQPLHWRQSAEISGLNTLAMGILHETAVRFAPHPSAVFAQASVFGSERKNADGESVEITVPDSLQILTTFDSGGAAPGHGIYHLSGITLHGPGNQIHLYGSQGTIRFNFAGEEEVWIGNAADPELRRLEVPDEERGGWRVEEEFISAIRGTEAVKFTTFETGVRYMEFTEAVTRSRANNARVEIPLD